MIIIHVLHSTKIFPKNFSAAKAFELQMPLTSWRVAVLHWYSGPCSAGFACHHCLCPCSIGLWSSWWGGTCLVASAGMSEAY